MAIVTPALLGPPLRQVCTQHRPLHPAPALRQAAALLWAPTAATPAGPHPFTGPAHERPMGSGQEEGLPSQPGRPDHSAGGPRGPDPEAAGRAPTTPTTPGLQTSCPPADPDDTEAAGPPAALLEGLLLGGEKPSSHSTRPGPFFYIGGRNGASIPAERPPPNPGEHPHPALLNVPHPTLVNGPHPALLNGPHPALLNGPHPTLLNGPHTALLNAPHPALLNGPTQPCISSYCRSKGWKRIQDGGREDYLLKWCEVKSRDSYSSFREGEQLLYQLPNSKLLTTKIGLLSTLRGRAQAMGRASRAPGGPPASYSHAAVPLSTQPPAFVKTHVSTHSAPTPHPAVPTRSKHHEWPLSQALCPLGCRLGKDAAAATLEDLPWTSPGHRRPQRPGLKPPTQPGTKEQRPPPRLPRRVLRMQDFFPETYRLDVKDERETFFALFDETQMWICKPTASNQGKGIFLLQSQEEVAALQAKTQSIEDDPVYHKLPLRGPQARVVQRCGAAPVPGGRGSGRAAPGPTAALQSPTAVMPWSPDQGARPFQLPPKMPPFPGGHAWSRGRELRKRPRPGVQFEGTQAKQPRCGAPRYIQDPLLLDGRKFDVRSYLLIACAMPYVVFFGHGYARLTLSLYDPRSSDLGGHLTNQFMQKKSPLYTLLKEDTVWSMERLNHHINDTFRKARGLPRDWVFTTLTEQMQQIMVHCFLAAKPKLECKLGYFDLIGCDFLIDDNFKVWLLEMNSNPALHTNCEVLKEVIPGVVTETLDLALETFQKSLRGQKMLPLRTQRRFVLLHAGEADQRLRPGARPGARRPTPPPSAPWQPRPPSLGSGPDNTHDREPQAPGTERPGGGNSDLAQEPSSGTAQEEHKELQNTRP
ncbi:Protein polyglycylase TTLL10 [Plecturocebus cupreus]